MTIIPSGAPFWRRNAGITQYGGDLNKKDFGGIGVINAKTDLSAAQYSRLTADQAAVSRTAAIMRLVFTPNAGSPVTTVNWCAPAWATPQSYADGTIPPSANYPTITGTGSSRTVTLPASATDDYGIVEAVAARIVFATGGIWSGTITSGAFTITGLTNGKTVSIAIF